MFTDEISKLTNGPIISLIDTTCDAVDIEAMQPVGLLASPNTIRKKLHKTLFNRSQVITLGESGQEETSQIIHAVIGGANDLETKLQDQIVKLMSNGAQKVVLGCTELSVINQSARFTNVIDPLDVICEKVMSDKV